MKNLMQTLKYSVAAILLVAMLPAVAVGFAFAILYAGACAGFAMFCEFAEEI